MMGSGQQFQSSKISIWGKPRSPRVLKLQPATETGPSAFKKDPRAGANAWGLVRLRNRRQRREDRQPGFNGRVGKTVPEALLNDLPALLAKKSRNKIASRSVGALRSSANGNSNRDDLAKSLRLY
jgi:hypothetical protein